ncbi:MULTISPECIES: FtsB family cell division protein [unclassified Roseivivax]|uniref:FtsB family cell division protein n=1 Tax=Roseivivax sp. GX 12232 TaxID=2900547 RepID=UPI001E516450|nr:septum formation initiator family protein [Roseivivax sp. GX 12232]MCE0505183.1 septum formation initiator family protein [Roseivivax sp. GX 12232]
MTKHSRPALGGLLFFAFLISVGAYFAFAAVQGDYGIFRRAEIEVEAKELETELAALEAEVARMENLTRRLSDDYLDLDLLDERAREVLGLLRHDEVVVR